MKNISKNKGFTLIELLVVIAIIGTLSSIVLASLSSARGKANEAKIQSQLVSIRSAAALYYSLHNDSYAPNTVVCTGGMFADSNSGISRLITAITTTDKDCNASASEYVVAAYLGSGRYWCVDSKNTSRGTNSSGQAYGSISTVGSNPALSSASATACN